MNEGQSHDEWGGPFFRVFYILVHVMVNVGTFYMDHYLE